MCCCALCQETFPNSRTAESHRGRWPGAGSGLHGPVFADTEKLTFACIASPSRTSVFKDLHLTFTQFLGKQAHLPVFLCCFVGEIKNK